MDDFWQRLFEGLIGSLVFGILGILLTILGFKIFDLITPKIDIQKEIAEKNNMAVAVVTSAIIIGVAIIAAVAVK